MPALKNGKVRRVSRSMQCPALRFDDFVSHRKPNQGRQRVKLLLLYPPRAVAFWGTNADP
jgi:hypothetical protein